MTVCDYCQDVSGKDNTSDVELGPMERTLSQQVQLSAASGHVDEIYPCPIDGLTNSHAGLDPPHQYIAASTKDHPK